jgi:hypothetical protein
VSFILSASLVPAVESGPDRGPAWYHSLLFYRQKRAAARKKQLPAMAFFDVHINKKGFFERISYNSKNSAGIAFRKSFNKGSAFQLKHSFPP